MNRVERLYDSIKILWLYFFDNVSLHITLCFFNNRIGEKSDLSQITNFWKIKIVGPRLVWFFLIRMIIIFAIHIFSGEINRDNLKISKSLYEKSKTAISCDLIFLDKSGSSNDLLIPVTSKRPSSIIKCMWFVCNKTIQMWRPASTIEQPLTFSSNHWNVNNNNTYIDIIEVRS